MSRKLITRLSPRAIFPDNAAPNGASDPMAQKRARETRAADTAKRGPVREAISALDVAGACAALPDLGYLLLIVKHAGHDDVLPSLAKAAASRWRDIVPDYSDELRTERVGVQVALGAVWRSVNRSPCGRCNGHGVAEIRRARVSSGKWRVERDVCPRCGGSGYLECSDAELSRFLGVSRHQFHRRFAKAIKTATRVLDNIEEEAFELLSAQFYRLNE